MDKTRIHDYKEVEKGLKSSSPSVREAASKAEYRLKEEAKDPRIKAMRSEVLKQTRRGRNDNANDIREDIQNYTKSGYGRTTFTFSMPEHIFKK